MLERKITFCRICEASCGLIAEVEGERVLKLMPDPEHVVSRGFACVKGIRYPELHHSPDRVLTPLKRVGDAFQPISWSQAFAEIGEKVKALRAQHGNDSVGMYIGNPSAFSVPHILLASLFNEALGTHQLYTPGSQDCNNKFVASEEMFGSPIIQPIPDVDRAKCIVLVGTNPAVSQLTFANTPRLMERLKAAEKGGARVFFVNPRRTESAQMVGEHLFIRPGSDVFFFLALAHLVFARRTLSHADAKRMEGLDAVRALVSPWTPERVAEVTGIDPSVLRALADAYLAADGAVLYAGTGVNQGRHGTLAVWLLNAITIVSGNLDRAGGMLITRQAMRASKVAPSGDRIRHSYSRIGQHRSVMDSWPAGILADEILTPGEGQLRALFVTAGNPLLSCANSARMHEALAQLELIVAIDLFRNETGQLAHYVLPVTSFLERTDVPMGMGGFQPIPYVQLAEPVVPPRGETRDEWWIFAQLAEACGTPLFGSKTLHWWIKSSGAHDSKLPALLRFRPKLLFSAMLALERITPFKLKKHPHGLLLGDYRGGQFLKKGVLTPNRKVQLAPKRFLEAAAALEASHDRLRHQNGALRLISKRERTSHNSWMHNVEAFVSGPRGTNYLYMHPSDAGARALKTGDRCEVRSATGSLQIQVKVTDELMPGTVALPHGWGHQRAEGLTVAKRTQGVNVNLLSPDGSESLESLAGMTHLTALDVYVAAT
jgi:anaerobic selenocysteine-containing dehydrogenase